jgi:hypothetical protein
VSMKRSLARSRGRNRHCVLMTRGD